VAPIEQDLAALTGIETEQDRASSERRPPSGEQPRLTPMESETGFVNDVRPADRVDFDTRSVAGSAPGVG